MRPAWIEVDLSAITHNVQEVCRFVGEGCRVAAVVKANGYGHGAVEVSKAALAGGASMLCVALLQEAVQLRDAGINAPILIMGAILPEEAEEVVAGGFEQTVTTLEAAKALSEAATRLGKEATIHVKVDTGMGRLGMPPTEVPRFFEKLRQLQGLRIAGLSTHYATADSDLTHAMRQLEHFRHVCDGLKANGFPVPPIRHTACSAAVTAMRESHLDMVRVGLLIYGIPPTKTHVREMNLRPAMTLKARITQIRNMPPGKAISYGRTFMTERDSVIAVLPIGYADGYSRANSNKSWLLVRGTKVPLRGRVCMDQIMVDVTAVPGVKLGDEAVLIGRQGSEEVSVWDVATWMGSVAHEVVAALGSRLPRVFLNG